MSNWSVKQPTNKRTSKSSLHRPLDLDTPTSEESSTSFDQLAVPGFKVRLPLFWTGSCCSLGRNQPGLFWFCCSDSRCFFIKFCSFLVQINLCSRMPGSDNFRTLLATLLGWVRSRHSRDTQNRLEVLALRRTFLLCLVLVLDSDEVLFSR